MYFFLLFCQDFLHPSISPSLHSYFLLFFLSLISRFHFSSLSFHHPFTNLPSLPLSLDHTSTVYLSTLTVISLQGVQNPAHLIQHRSLLILNHLTKMLASKRLASDRQLFRQVFIYSIIVYSSVTTCTIIYYNYYFTIVFYCCKISWQCNFGLPVSSIHR